MILYLQRGLPEEEYGGPGGRAVSPVGSDLWESASLDYPGREDAQEFDPIDEYDVSLLCSYFLNSIYSFFLDISISLLISLILSVWSWKSCFLRIFSIRLSCITT